MRQGVIEEQMLAGGPWGGADWVRGLPGVVRRTVFSSRGRAYSWLDVLAAAVARGDWAAVERRAAAPGAATGRGSVEEWRRARKLLSADDATAWLLHWGIEMAEVERYLGVRDVDARAVGIGGDGRAVWVEAVCSGVHVDLVWGLAARIALAPEPLEEGVPLDEAALLDLEDAFQRRRVEIETSDAVTRLIMARSAEWMRVRFRGLTVTDRDVAREAVLCVSIDGMRLEEVASMCGVEVEETLVFLDELDPPSRLLVASARAGELLGPIESGAGHRVIELVRKEPPTADDPAVLARARKAALRAAISRESAMRLEWHERF